MDYSLMTRLAAEMIGTALLIVLGNGAVANVDLKGTKKDINMNLSTLSNNKTILSPKLSITNNNLKSSFKNSKKIKPSRKKSK